jgi:hypothetical protein
MIAVGPAELMELAGPPAFLLRRNCVVEVKRATPVSRRSAGPFAVAGASSRSTSAGVALRSTPCRGWWQESGVVAKCLGQAASRADPELREDVVEVPLHRPWAEEQPRADLGVRKPVTRKARDLTLLPPQLLRVGATGYAASGHD